VDEQLGNIHDFMMPTGKLVPQAVVKMCRCQQFVVLCSSHVTEFGSSHEPGHVQLPSGTLGFEAAKHQKLLYMQAMHSFLNIPRKFSLAFSWQYAHILYIF
jgi:hypothetical protein